MNLQNYDLKVIYKPGKDLLVADAHVRLNVNSLPISNEKMLPFQKETAYDPELQLVISYVSQGWPYKNWLPVNS